MPVELDLDNLDVALKDHLIRQFECRPYRKLRLLDLEGKRPDEPTLSIAVSSADDVKGGALSSVTHPRGEDGDLLRHYTARLSLSIAEEHEPVLITAIQELIGALHGADIPLPAGAIIDFRFVEARFERFVEDEEVAGVLHFHFNTLDD